MSQFGRTFTNSGPGGFVQTLTGNSGGPVGPLAGNINVVGDTTTINVVGNPATNTLTISASGSGLVSSITTDDGHVVTPTGGTIKVHGTHGLNTTGTIGPNTATVAINNAITLGDLSVLAANAGAVTATTGDVIITAGDLTLPNTNTGGTQGIIKFGGNRWISNFNDNHFFGRLAGNTTVTGGNNCGFGDSSLRVVGAGSENSCFGSTSGFNITSGNFNTLIGYQSGGSVTSGSENCAMGQGSLFEATTAAQNCAIGAQALETLLTGTNNIALGFDCGLSYNSAESNNILIGNSGSVGENNTLRIGTTGGGASQQNNCYIAGISTVNVGSVASVVSISGDHLGSTTITAGSNITVTPGANTITIAATATPAGTYPYTNVATTPYVVLTTDVYISVDSSGGVRTIQLPNAATSGQFFIIKDRTGSAATNNITVTTVGGAVNIDGATTFVMNTAYQSINVMGNGSTYEIF